MTPADLSLTVLHAVRRAVDEGALRAEVPQRIAVERPRPGGSGDYATNAALRLAREAGMPPLRIAEVLSARIAREPGIAAVEITGPGFLNITLDRAGDAELVRRVLAQGTEYGRGRSMAGQVLQYHHRPEVRAAVTADAVRRLLLAQGALVRTSCDKVDPYWARLGVAVGAEGVPPVPLDEVRAVPAGADAAELLRRLGPDAARWALLRPAAHDHPRLGDELLVQGEGNPLFRVRYAHSRVRALLRNATQLDIPSVYEESVDAPALLTAVGDHPAVLEAAARLRAPDRVARHLEATADALLGFQHRVLPLGDEKPSAAHRSRLALAEAAGTVLAGGLSLLGISAPDYL